MLAAVRAARQAPIARAFFHDVSAAVQGFFIALADRLHDGGATGVALYGLVYVAGSLLALPLWLLSGLAGFAWGFPWGLAAAVPGLAIGATSAFFVGRAVGATRLGDALRERPTLKTVDAVVRHDGRRIATLLRLSPVMPQNFLHFILGTTPLGPLDFVLSTVVGLFPMTCVHVYAASLLHSATEFVGGSSSSLRDPATVAKLAAGLVVTAVMLALVMRRARQALAQAYVQAGADATPVEP